MPLRLVLALLLMTVPTLAFGGAASAQEAEPLRDCTALHEEAGDLARCRPLWHRPQSDVAQWQGSSVGNWPESTWIADAETDTQLSLRVLVSEFTFDGVNLAIVHVEQVGIVDDAS